MIDRQAIATILGQRGEQLISLTGWTAGDPGGRHDTAHLLLHPLGGGVARQMAELADALGLARADSGTLPQVPPDITWARIGPREHDGTSVWLHVGADGWLHRPVPEDWITCAQAHREVILWLYVDAGRARTSADLDRIVSTRHPDRLWAGRIRLAD